MDSVVVIGSALVVAGFATALGPVPAKAFLDSPALDESFRALEFQDAGEALLWVDVEGNVGASVNVEQIVFFDRAGHPIGQGVSERCRRSVERSRGATAVVCFADNALAKATGMEP